MIELAKGHLVEHDQVAVASVKFLASLQTFVDDQFVVSVLPRSDGETLMSIFDYWNRRFVQQRSISKADEEGSGASPFGLALFLLSYVDDSAMVREKVLSLLSGLYDDDVATKSEEFTEDQTKAVYEICCRLKACPAEHLLKLSFAGLLTDAADGDKKRDEEDIDFPTIGDYMKKGGLSGLAPYIKTMSKSDDLYTNNVDALLVDVLADLENSASKPAMDCY